MLVKASAKFIRISPSRLREVMNYIRGKSVSEAEGLLLNISKRAKGYIQKVLKSAIANAKVKGFNPGQLYVSKVTADNGPIWKRFKAAAFGRAAKIRKRTSHITIELDLKNK
ncbi:MAG: 50S ribosomal protein L22 [Omnitrophica WOR_2 bacterium RIFCSPLOWO2_12_FULL_46_30]|nr:MAG: 50S ribosomal protein L22 [Omnitrophica WOR_2 bacterium RIFCSPHIGHO2_02_FULL_46_37]OGX43033.1 MAG: 50S ribosomal protein L22 [Omnitrophica WOR_2 bacterium RIFCSPLOWO2_02_FULL_45_28]OGX49901.1 MAG: 50S ribosomal protein L22 [Omnitrophica WOR_2 bacterium RIFCSPLOWO2_12_FULL_46_30]